MNPFNPFTLLVLLSLAMTLIILSALALDHLLDDSDRRALRKLTRIRRRNPFLEERAFWTKGTSGPRALPNRTSGPAPSPAPRRGRREETLPARFTASTTNAEFLDNARRKMKAIMTTAPRDPNGLVKYHP